MPLPGGGGDVLCSGWPASPTTRRLDRPVTDGELAEAYRANALFDAHRDDPEFGHRFLLDEARAGR
ncbi:hypothetical protein [Streptomyces sp. NPDC056663]|uniref:hypothetical protein n=1 Tax=Streptomyces sp. NPDC056663 TaxID=3345899 RepID=UPI0036CDFBFD